MCQGICGWERYPLSIYDHGHPDDHDDHDHPRHPDNHDHHPDDHDHPGHHDHHLHDDNHSQVTQLIRVGGAKCVYICVTHAVLSQMPQVL